MLYNIYRYDVGIRVVITMLIIGRSTYLSEDLGFTAILSFCRVFRHLPPELAERNSCKTGRYVQK